MRRPPATNPFRAGSPVTGEHFGDRETERAFLVSRMTSGQNVFVVSPRRYGKTSLLLGAAEEARQRGARVAVANLFYCSSRRDIAETLTRAVVERALGWAQGTREQISQRMRRLPGVTPRLEHDGWTYSLAITRPDDSILEEIRRPVELLAESARSSRPVCLVLDEFQEIASIDAGLAGIFKGIIDDLPLVSLVFAGSRRHVMRELFAGSGGGLQHAAEPLALSVIPEQEMSPFLMARAASSARPMSPAGARLTFSLMRGIPHFVQLLAGAAWDRGEIPIDEPVVRRALVDVLNRQQGDLALRFEELTTVQRRLMRALATAPERHIHSTAFSRRSRVPVASTARSLRRLEESDQLIWDERVGWRVYDPVFERWLVHATALDGGEPIDPDSMT